MYSLVRRFIKTAALGTVAAGWGQPSSPLTATPMHTPLPRPDGVTQRYERLACRLGIDTTFHRLRHYSATELIVGGVDPRTVAGRLGHGGGGTTTLKTYTAWVSEADQRAASGLGTRMPARPDPSATAALEREPAYLRTAGELRRRIADGELRAGGTPPAEKQVAAEFGVSVGTAHRVLGQLREWGLVELVDGRRRIVAPAAPAPVPEPVSPAAAMDSRFWSVVLRGPNGRRYPARMVVASLADPSSFRAHLVGIARVEVPEWTDDGEGWIGDFELEVSEPESFEPAVTLRW